MHILSQRFLLSIMLGALVLGASSCSGEGSVLSYGPIINSTVSGTVAYEDLSYGSGGLSASGTMKPVRYAEVEVVNYLGGDVLAVGVTNALGRYSIDYKAYENSYVYIRALASTSGAGIPPVTVLNNSNALYGYGSGHFAVGAQPTNVDLSIEASGEAGGAFNILDVLTAAGQFVYAREGVTPAALTAMWTKGSSPYGTRYYSNAAVIVVGGHYTDTDEYDDDVLWHEYGHFASDKFSVSDSPGGSHSGLDTDLDIRLSWGEGFATYFETAVKKWLSASATLSGIPSYDVADGTGVTHYVDTDYIDVGNYIDIAAASAPDYVYSTNEIAVASVLVGLESLVDVQAVWDVFSVTMPASSYYASLETFWDGWVNTQGDSTSAQTLLTDREINYYEDGFESDDVFADAMSIATDGTPQDRTFYKDDLSDDADVVSFVASTTATYLIETLCLSNAADTVITVYDSVEAYVDENDDFTKAAVCTADAYTPNASRLALPLSAGTYYIEVTSFTPDDIYYPVSGRYGTYSLSVTKQ